MGRGSGGACVRVCVGGVVWPVKTVPSTSGAWCVLTDLLQGHRRHPTSRTPNDELLWHTTAVPSAARLRVCIWSAVCLNGDGYKKRCGDYSRQRGSASNGKLLDETAAAAAGIAGREHAPGWAHSRQSLGPARVGRPVRTGRVEVRAEATHVVASSSRTFATPHPAPGHANVPPSHRLPNPPGE